MSSNIKIPNIFGIEINIKKTISHFWDRPVPIFSDVRFSYLALVQDKKITCVLPANACCTVYVNCVLIWCQFSLLWLSSFQLSKHSLHINSWSQLIGIFFLHLSLTMSVDIIYILWLTNYILIRSYQMVLNRFHLKQVMISTISSGVNWMTNLCNWYRRQTQRCNRKRSTMI